LNPPNERFYNVSNAICYSYGAADNKNRSTFLKEPSRNRIRIRLFIRTVKKFSQILDLVACLKVELVEKVSEEREQ